VIAAACGSTVSALTAHYLATDSILIGGDDALRARYLPAAAEGTKLGAFALTEPYAGSDPADMRTRAERTADGYRIRGRKCFISNGGIADFLVVYAVTDPAAAHRGISAFVVDKGTPGLTPGRVEKTMGLRGGHVWELDLDLTVPAENRLGAEGTGFRTAMKVLDNGRLEVAAMCIGMAGAALAHATDWAKTRIIGGEPLASKQGIRWMLADMALDLRAAPADRARGRPPAPGRHPLHRGRQHGQAPCLRDGRPRHRRRAADPRRLRLHPRLPARTPRPRRADHADLRGLLRDPAQHHRRPRPGLNRRDPP
jgi:alkylation response protein AidB-like acyl-CoA dehydrogenase